MRNIFLKTIIATLLAVPALGQTLDRGRMKAMDDSKNYLIEKGIEKTILTMDYNSWFEKLTAKNAAGTEQESQALYFGFGLGAEKNWYQPKWGWGIGGSVLGGSAVGGDKGGSLSYFQARTPWWGVRISPRIFYRWTPSTDFGVDLALLYKNAKWPNGSTADITATSGSEMIAGAFIDMRVRFNPKIEMIQSFGSVYKDASIYWRLGLAYRL